MKTRRITRISQKDQKIGDAEFGDMTQFSGIGIVSPNFRERLFSALR